MSTRELIQAAGTQQPWVLFALLLGPIVFTFVLTLLHEKGDDKYAPWKYLYSLVIFAVFIPGIFVAVTSGYTFFFTHENLLDQSPFVVFGPFFTMVLVVQAMKRVDVDINGLPGFGRLLGLILMIGGATILAIILNKLDIRVWILGSTSSLLWLFIGLLVLIRVGWWFMFDSK